MSNYIVRKYEEFIAKKGYIPQMFNAYNCAEIRDIAPTLSTNCGSATSSASVLIIDDTMGFEKEPRIYKDVAPSLRASRFGLKVAEIMESNMTEELKLPGAYGRKFGSRGKVQDTDGICDTLQAAMGAGGGNVPIVKERTEMNKDIGIIRAEPLERDGWHRNAKEVINPEGISRTISAQSNNLATKIEEQPSLRVRKLTPKETWRLMGFEDADFEKAEKVNSNTQLYKQAGNSIVVQVNEAILGELVEAGVF